MQFHPVANLFPMLTEDELTELAEDIKQRGLLHPIVLDAHGRILDGRNRHAACQRAGIQPEYVTYDGDDPAGYALSVNIARRHLTQGQRAIVIARSYKLYDLGGVTATADQHRLPQARISQAKLIVEHADDLADQVLSGSKPFDAAYREAQDRQKLGRGHPDLAALVKEGRMTLAEALSLAATRDAAALDHATRVSDTFRSIVGRILATYCSDELRTEVARIYQDDLGAAMPAEINADTIREAGDSLLLIAEAWKKERQS